MEPFAIALVPVLVGLLAGYLGWITKLVVDSVRLQATVATKLEHINTELTHTNMKLDQQDTRINALVTARFMG